MSNEETIKKVELRINFDDQIEDVIKKFEEILKQFGIELRDDEELHPGFVVLTISRKG
jgi:hypothetical protein